MKAYRMIVAALIVGLGAWTLHIAAVDRTGERPQEARTLILWSGYASDAALGGLEARSLHFALEPNADGWSGWLTLDPNLLSFSKFGDMTETTLMMGERVEVDLRLVAEDRGGRKCYRVEQARFDERIHLVFPSHAQGTYRLMIGGERTNHVVLMESQSQLSGVIPVTVSAR